MWDDMMIRTDMKQLLTLIIAGSREERQQSEEQQHVAKETSCTHTVTSSRMFLVIFVVNFIIRGQLQQFLYKSIRIFLTIRSFCYLLGDDLLCLKCRWYNKSLLPPQLHLHLSVHNYLWSKSSLFLIENRPTTFHQDSDDSLKIGQPLLIKGLTVFCLLLNIESISDKSMNFSLAFFWNWKSID